MYYNIGCTYAQNNLRCCIRCDCGGGHLFRIDSYNYTFMRHIHRINVIVDQRRRNIKIFGGINTK